MILTETRTVKRYLVHQHTISIQHFTHTYILNKLFVCFSLERDVWMDLQLSVRTMKAQLRPLVVKYFNKGFVIRMR